MKFKVGDILAFRKFKSDMSKLYSNIFLKVLEIQPEKDKLIAIIFDLREIPKGSEKRDIISFLDKCREEYSLKTIERNCKKATKEQKGRLMLNEI